MKNLKNISLALVLGLIVSSSAVSAAEIIKDVHVGVSQVEVLGESALGYVVGYGYSRYSNNGLYFGGSFYLDSVELEYDTALAYGVNLKLGYCPIKKLAIYGLGSAMQQTIGHANGLGFGYGLGIDYRVFEHIAVSAEYKTHSMTLEGLIDYDYDLAGVNLKYIF